MERGCYWPVSWPVSPVGWAPQKSQPSTTPPQPRPPTPTTVATGVHDIYDVVEGPAWREGEARYSKLVFIGRGLDAAALEAQLRRCVAGAAEGGSS